MDSMKDEGMEWTRQKPRYSGYYWIGADDLVQLVFVWMRSIPGPLVVLALGAAEVDNVNDTDVWWFGPIEIQQPPALPQETPNP